MKNRTHKYFTLSKSCVCCLIRLIVIRKEGKYGWKKDVKEKPFWDSTFPHTEGFVCSHTTTKFCHICLVTTFP